MHTYIRTCAISTFSIRSGTIRSVTIRRGIRASPCSDLLISGTLARRAAAPTGPRRPPTVCRNKKKSTLHLRPSYSKATQPSCRRKQREIPVKNIQSFRTHYLNDNTESDVANEDRSSGISSFLTINKRRIVSYGIVKKRAELR